MSEAKEQAGEQNQVDSDQWKAMAELKQQMMDVQAEAHRKEISELQQQLQAKERDRDHSSQEKIDNAQWELIDDLKRQLAQMQSKASGSPSSSGKEQQLEGLVQDQGAQIVELKQQLQEMTDAGLDLARDVQSKQSRAPATADNATMKEIKSAHEKEIRRLEGQLREAEENTDKVADEYMKEISALQLKLHSQQERAQQIEHQLENHAVELGDEHVKTISELQLQLDDMQTEHAAAQLAKDTTTEELSGAVSRLKEQLEGQRQRYEELLRDKNVEIDELHTAIQNQKAHAAAKNTELAEAQAQMLSPRKAEGKLKQQLEDQKDLLRSLEEELQREQASKAKLQEKSRRDANEFAKQLSEEQEQKEAAQQDAAELGHRMKELKHELSAMHREKHAQTDGRREQELGLKVGLLETQLKEAQKQLEANDQQVQPNTPWLKMAKRSFAKCAEVKRSYEGASADCDSFNRAELVDYLSTQDGLRREFGEFEITWLLANASEGFQQREKIDEPVWIEFVTEVMLGAPDGKDMYHDAVNLFMKADLNNDRLLSVDELLSMIQNDQEVREYLIQCGCCNWSEVFNLMDIDGTAALEIRKGLSVSMLFRKQEGHATRVCAVLLTGNEMLTYTSHHLT